MASNHMRYVCLLLLAAFSQSACSSTPPIALGDASGSWTRNYCGQLLSCGMTMVIAQAGSTLSGSFTEVGWSGVNALSGTITDRRVVVGLSPPLFLAQCTTTMTGVINGDQWTGTAQTFQMQRDRAQLVSQFKTQLISRGPR